MKNKIYFTQAWDNSRNIGRYYNEFMRMLPNNSWGCLMDYDAMFLTNDYGKHLYEYIKKFPDATFTCRTNRLHISNNIQQLSGIERENHDINYHKKIAEERKALVGEVTDISKPKNNVLMGGMLMLVNKKTWKEVGGFSETGILNVDNNFHLSLLENKKKLLVMEGVYIYHWYRADGCKKHLL